MATLSAAIMAHPDRAKHVHPVLEVLGEDVPVAWDDEGPPSRDRDRRWRTGRRAWMLHDPDAEWHMVLQDDVRVCADLLDGLRVALDHLPGDGHGIVQPYFGTRRPERARPVPMALADKADREGASWVQMPALNWGVAIIARTDTIDPMVQWCEHQTQWGYDKRVGQYYLKHGYPTFYTWPSLVDHLDLPSLVGHGRARATHHFHAGSALDLDWDGGKVVDPRMVHMSLTRRRPMPEGVQLRRIYSREQQQLKRQPGQALRRRGV